MSTNQERTYRLFNTARNLALEDRGAYLDKECREDDALRVEVDALLKYYDFTSAQTENSGEEKSHTVDYEPGDSINQFKILGGTFDYSHGPQLSITMSRSDTSTMPSELTSPGDPEVEPQ
jgi:hypothetical protein